MESANLIPTNYNTVLGELKQRIRAALDSALDAFVLLRVIDGAAVDFEIEDLNARGEVLFGADRNELIGQRLTCRGQLADFEERSRHLVGEVPGRTEHEE